MNSSPLKLKNPRNWFAAGIEVQQALAILSDGAFKAFMHICLNAERTTGLLPTTQGDLARMLQKSLGATRKYLVEMEKSGVCINRFSNNPTTRGSIQISSAFWPYERDGVASANDNAVEAYIGEIKSLLSARACIRIAFSTADEVLVRRWFNDGIPLECIDQAILMGCARKYVAWRNNQTVHGSIVTLRYFDPIIDEVGKQKLDADYWEFLRFKIQRQEKLWNQKHQEPGSELNAEVPSCRKPSKVKSE